MNCVISCFRMHEKLFESTISIKSYRPTLLFDKRCKNIKLWSKDEKSPPDNVSQYKHLYRPNNYFAVIF